MAKKFKVKTKNSFGDKILRNLARMVKKPRKIINLNDHDLESRCIMIGNHAGASGPFNYRQSFEKVFMTWGAHQMCEGFRSRWNYLYHTFYQQKLHWGKFKSFVVASLFNIIAPLAYGYAGIIPIYYDNRIVSTFRYSIKCLETDTPVLVFPEDSENGYQTVIDSFYPGFIKISSLYYKRYKVDLPVYTMRIFPETKRIIIGKPMYIQEMLKTMTEEEVSEEFRKYLNSLYYDYAQEEDKK